MNKQTKFNIQKWVFLGLALLLAGVLAGCDPPPTPTPVQSEATPPPNTPIVQPEATVLPDTPTPEQPIPEAPTIIPGEEIFLAPGDQEPITASVAGAVSYEWELIGDGKLSGTGPTVIYFAPEQGDGLSVLTVTAVNAQGTSPQTSLTINIVAPSPVLNLTFESPQAGDQIPVGTEMRFQGSYSPSDQDITDTHIWIMLQDTIGNYCLQSPPITLMPSGRWEAFNIRFGKDIIRVLAVQVTQVGHETFSQKVKDDDFSCVPDLPADGKTVGSIDINP